MQTRSKLATILFDIFPAHGHYNGSFPLALLLKNAGHTVHYICTNEFHQKVKSLNIGSFVINPFIILPFKVELKEKGIIRYFIEHLLRFSIVPKKKHIEKQLNQYDMMIDRLKPDLVILDEHHAYKSIFYWNYGLPQATIQTSLSPDYDPLIPPFTSTYVPKKTSISYMRIKYLWQRHKIKTKSQMLYNKFLSFGNTPKKYYRLFAKKYSFPFDNELIKPRSIGIRFGNIPSLVAPPEAFDLPRKETRNLYHIGPIHHDQTDVQMVEGRLKSVMEDISNEKVSNPNLKLIYCSLGTVTAEYLKICGRFFNHIAKVCSRNKDWKFILSVGTFFKVSEISSMPSNLYVFDKVPQLALLEQCDLFINHGGMNSIYECIMAEKPMVVFPLSLKVDQNGNAARVVYHQIGVKGVIRRASTKSIEKLINKVIDQEDYYVRNARNLKAKFIDKSSYTLDLIDRIIKKGNHVGQEGNKQAVC